MHADAAGLHGHDPSLLAAREAPLLRRLKTRFFLSSGTTHDLLDGSGLAFEFRGAHELKGLAGARPIFALVR